MTVLGLAAVRRRRAGCVRVFPCWKVKIGLFLDYGYLQFERGKSTLGRLADRALKGRPTVISRGGKLVILQAYDPPDPNQFDELIQEGIDSEHTPLNSEVWAGIRRRGRKLAKSVTK